MVSLTYKYDYELVFPYSCKICGKEVRSKPGLASHIKNQHKGISYFGYLLSHENIDLQKQINVFESGRENRRKEGYKKAGIKKSGKTPIQRMTTEQYTNWRKSMANVFTLPWFQTKYGLEEGGKKYLERAGLVAEKSFFKIFNQSNRNNYSKISQELFWEIHRRMGYIAESHSVYFAELNHEYGCGTNKNFDFVDLDAKKIIEFNGDKWHANPEIYGEDFLFYGRTAKEVWEADRIKYAKCKEKGFTIWVVWQSNYEKNKEKVINECLDFLKKRP